MRKIAIPCAVVGLILVLAAFLLPFWITPSYIARLQSNSNTVRNYDGQVLTLVNPAALNSGNLAGAVITGVPETLRRQVTVQDTSGNTALVRDATTASTAQRTIGSISSQYAVDRTSLEATASHPSNWNITHATGLTFNWPLGAQPHNYTGWVPFTHTTVALKYLRQQPQAGINTNVYQATIPATPVRNPQVLGALPRSLPATLLPEIAKSGLVPASELAELARAYPNATSLPVSYVYSGTSTYWVAPPTGIVVNTRTTESQVGGIVLPSRQFLPIFPVLSDNYGYTPSTIQSAVNDAKNDSSTINTWGIGVPIAAGLVGFALLAAAALLWIRGRRHGVGGREERVGGPSLDPAHAGTRSGAGPGDRADWQYEGRPGSGGTGAGQRPGDRRLVSRRCAVSSLGRHHAHGQPTWRRRERRELERQGATSRDRTAAAGGDRPVHLAGAARRPGGSGEGAHAGR
jgi:Porin PorA